MNLIIKGVYNVRGFSYKYRNGYVKGCYIMARKGSIMKKILVLGMILLFSIGIAGCEGKSDSTKNMSEPESFVTLQKDEIVTSETHIEELHWENEKYYQ